MSKRNYLPEHKSGQVKPDGTDPKPWDNYSSNKKRPFVNFDRKVNTFLIACSLGFVLLVFFKIHGSSISIWDSITGNNHKKSSVIFGTPKSIRSDEWLVQTPFLISQYNRGFQNENESWGAYQTPVAMGGPAKEVASYLKINYLGFFLLDLEHGYAFYWNFKVFFLLVSSFLVFLILTNNNFWLSVFGSFWLFLSSATQWWLSTSLPEMFISLGFIVFGLTYFIFSSKVKSIVLSAIVILLFSWILIFHIYPPFQLLTLYLILALTGSIVIKYWDKELINKQLNVKISLFALVLVIDILCLYIFYTDAKATIDVVRETIYPGQRLVDHGNFTLSRFFVNFFDAFFSETKFPSIEVWYNICESSGFIMLFPFVIPLAIIGMVKRKKIDFTYVLLLSFIFILGLRCFVAMPEIYNKVTLLNMVSSVRCHLFLGFAGLILTIYFLNETREDFSLTLIQKGAFLFFALVFYILLYMSINPIMNKYVSTQQFFLIGLMIFILSWLLISNFKYGNVAFALIIILYLLPNITVNPVTKGLSSILNNPLYKQVKSVEDKDSKWVVFGHMTFSNFLKSTGANVISGVNYTPEKDKLEILDPQNRFKEIHNRYAHISFYPFVTGTDSVAFVSDGNRFTDSYTIAMDPCSPRFKKLGVKYYLFTYQPQPVEVRGLTLVSSNGVLIYKNDL